MTLRQIEKIVGDRIGLDPDALGPSVFPVAVNNRMKALGLATIADYLATLASTPEECTALACELVVPESWFFRGGRELFRTLAMFVQARVKEHASSSPVQILTVPCSTGEEPYSLAIALHELGLHPQTYQIQAIDLSALHVARAKAAVYGSFAFREPFNNRNNYFIQVGERWSLRPEYQKQVQFRTGNLLDLTKPDDQRRFELIISRNVFIYLTPDARERAMATLDQLLAPEGWLCLSPAEANRLVPGQFVAEGSPQLGIYRRAQKARPLDTVTPVRIPPRHPGPPKLFASSQRLQVENPRTLDIPAQVLVTQPYVLAKEPVEGTSRFNQIRTLANSGQIQLAKQSCQELLTQLPGSAESHALWGIICQAEGRFEEATISFRRALYLDPDHSESLHFMALLAESRGARSEAVALRRRLAQLEKGDSQ